MPRWAWRTIAAVLAACALFPIWSVRYLPLLDLPNHLASVGIWHHIGDPEWRFADSYRLQITPFPYLLFHGPLHLFAYLMPIAVAAKLYLSIYALALPASVGALAAALGRPRQWGLMAFPFVYSWPLCMGWLAFAMGLAAALGVLALFVRVLDEEDASPKRYLALGAGACAVYLLHVIPWVFLGVAAAIAAAVRVRSTPRERVARGLLLLLPSVELAVGETRLARAAGVPIEAGGAGWQVEFEPWKTLAHEAGRRLLDVSQRRFDEVALALVGGSVLLLVVTGLRGVEVPWLREEQAMVGAPVGRRNGVTIVLMLAAALAGWLLLPVEIHRPFHMWQIGGRFVLIAALVALVLPARSLTRARALALVPALAAGVIHPIALAADFRAFGRAVDGFDKVVEQIPVGSATLAGASGDLMAPGGRVRALRMFPQYLQVLRGGYSPYNFSIGFPMAYRQERPAPPWQSQEQISFRDHAPYYDYVLTFRASRPRDAGGFTVVAEAGPWRLFKNPKPPKPPPSGYQNPPNR